ncbi:subclass B1 metallo-beta-lactamase [Anaerosolibacter sp.]|uniref:subclass B1 metallo-beta-lactamase n=1 Tax=Anaerosolibacter sp. TaxID=1872527 RepID=UPI0039EED020
MRKIYLLFVSMIITLSMIACSSNLDVNSNPKVDESSYKSGSNDQNYIELSKVKDNVWVHTSYENYNGNRTPSNGMLVITSEGIVLIDTPWNNGQMKELLKLSKKIFNEEITTAIITHAHVDRIGGIDTLKDNGMDVLSTSQTAQEAEKNGYTKPQPTLNSEQTIVIGNKNFEIFYPGEGHAVDNITVWLPDDKVLFGGCLIKSLESQDLGSVTDANIEQWPLSVEKVLEKYANAETVIPGHGKWGDIELIHHTVELFTK